MSVKPWRAFARHFLRFGMLAALVTVSLSPRGPAGAASTNQSAGIAPAGVPYTLSLSGMLGSGDTLIPDLADLNAPAIATMACRAAAGPITITFGGIGKAAPLAHGGDTLLVRAGGLPPRRVFALLLDVPRARRSANVTVPIDYSPPTVTAASDARGNLVDEQGKIGARVTMPNDASSGTGTLSLIEQGSSRHMVQRLLVRPHSPTLEVHALDARGRVASGAEVRLAGASGAICASRTDAGGNLLLTNLPPGPASVSVLRGAEDLGAYHPDLVAGETIVLRAAPDLKAGPTVMTDHSVLNCDKRTGYTYALRDSASGLATAASGDGPFGVFIAGIATADTFTAHVTGKAADGSLGPIAHNAPIVVSVITVNKATVAIKNVVGGDVPGGGPAGPAGYTNVTFRLDVGALPAGKNYIQINVGAPSSFCESLYEVSVVTDPTSTSLGTVDSYFDAATNSYQVDGVLPSHPKLRFHEPLDFSLPSQSLGAAQLPPVDFQDWNNEGQIGLEIHETIRTDGSWSGTVGGHARLILFNYTLVNEALPELQGSGPNLRTGSMKRTIHLLGKSIDTSLYNYLVIVPELGIILVVNLRFDAGGNVDAEIGVPPTLDQAYFTIDPTVTGSIIGSATLPTPFGTFSAELSGNLGLAAPVTLKVPGGPQVHVGMLVSVTAKFGSPLGSPSPLRLLPPQCVGDCGPAGQSIRAYAASLPASASKSNATAAVSMLSGRSSRTTTSPLGPVTVTLMAGKTAPNAQPTTALAPDGTAATLWVSSRSDGALALHAQVGHGAPRTLSTSTVALATPQIAWIGPRRALAVWMASTASSKDVAQFQSAPPDARKDVMRSLLARQQLFSSQWDGKTWSTPTMITDGTSINAEPSLAADPATGRAVLAWVRGPSAFIDPGLLSGLSIASTTFEHGTWSRPAVVSRSSKGAANAPSVAIDRRGGAGVAWLDGALGMGQAMFSRQGPAGWTVPTVVAGLPGSAQRITLAFDAQRRPVLVEEASQTLYGARLQGDTHWSRWRLGPGAMPHLVRGAAAGVVLLAERSAISQISGLSYYPVLAVLDETGWSPRTRMTSDMTTQADGALAVDAETGGTRIVLGARPSAPYPATDNLMNRGADLATLDLPGAGVAALIPESVTLSDAHPVPGAPVTVDVRVRNLATVPIAAGASVGVRISYQGHTVSRIVRSPRAVSPYSDLTLRIPLIAPSAPIMVTATAGSNRISATLGLPKAPSNVTVAPANGSNATLVQWNAAGDHGIGGYRVYRLAANGNATLAGFSHGTTWIDPRAVGTNKRYAVRAVDTEGRVSQATSN